MATTGSEEPSEAARRRRRRRRSTVDHTSGDRPIVRAPLPHPPHRISMPHVDGSRTGLSGGARRASVLAAERVRNPPRQRAGSLCARQPHAQPSEAPGSRVRSQASGAESRRPRCRRARATGDATDPRSAQLGSAAWLHGLRPMSSARAPRGRWLVAARTHRRACGTSPQGDFGGPRPPLGAGAAARLRGASASLMRLGRHAPGTSPASEPRSGAVQRARARALSFRLCTRRQRLHGSMRRRRTH